MRRLYKNLWPLTLLTVLGCGDAKTETTQNGRVARQPAVQQSIGEGQLADVFLPADGPTEKDYPELHNLMQVTGSLYSGAEPKTEAAFEQLAKLGVKVIVSVDGAKPKVELAEKYGIRYVHIPIGYDGIHVDAAKAFAQAADELKEPTYVHCHHGKHRGPAGVAAICVARGDADGTQALQILEKIGTSKGYAGLWRDVEGYQRPTPGEELPALVAVAKVGSLAAAMAQIDRASDNLKLCEAAQWKTPVDHPDISARQEALLLKEGFRETVRQLEEANDYDKRFLTWMKESEATATRFEAALQASDMEAIKSRFAEVQNECKRCHNDYRN